MTFIIASLIGHKILHIMILKILENRGGSNSTNLSKNKKIEKYTKLRYGMKNTSSNLSHRKYTQNFLKKKNN